MQNDTTTTGEESPETTAKKHGSKAALIKLIESDSKLGAYDMRFTRILCDHETEGRLLLVEGFGGNSVEGQTYRFKHGSAYLVAADATLASIDREEEESLCPLEELFPALDWSGVIVNSVAKKLLQS